MDYNMQTQYDQITKVADIGAAISIGGFSLTLHAANEIVQLLAGLVAIVAGIAAAVFHIKRIRSLKDTTNE